MSMIWLKDIKCKENMWYELTEEKKRELDEYNARMEKIYRRRQKYGSVSTAISWVAVIVGIPGDRICCCSPLGARLCKYGF